MTSPDARPQLDAALVYAGGVVADIRPDQTTAATPCEGLDVGELLGHLLSGTDWFSDVAETGSAGGFPEGGRVDDDLAARFEAVASRARAAWADDARLGHTYAMPWGPAPGWQLVGYLVVEVLVHGWDLARATGQPTALPEEAAAMALTSVQQWGEEVLRAPGMFGPAVEPPAGAAPGERLVAFLGRTP